MNLSKFQDEVLPHLPQKSQDRIVAVLAEYALMKRKPCFVMRREPRFSSEAWVLMFALRQTFWINVFATKQNVIDYCNKYDMELVES